MTAPGYCNAHGLPLVPINAGGGVWNTCPRCEAESQWWSEVTSGQRNGRLDVQVSH